MTQEPQQQNPRLTPIRLHAAIVETLWANVSAGSLEHVCDLLGMPAGPPDVFPLSSKRVYVRERLKGFGRKCLGCVDWLTGIPGSVRLATVQVTRRR